MSTSQATSVTGVAASAPLLLDPNSAAGNSVGVFLEVGAGCTVSVQITPDDPADPAAFWVVTGVGNFTNRTSNISGELAAPARGIRLNQSVGANTSVLKVVTPVLR